MKLVLTKGAYSFEVKALAATREVPPMVKVEPPPVPVKETVLRSERTACEIVSACLIIVLIFEVVTYGVGDIGSDLVGLASCKYCRDGGSKS